MLSSGLVHIYTGNGKGKTTAAVGLGLRAHGRGLKVLMVQFLKGSDTGEIEAISKLSPAFTLKRGKRIEKFTWQMNEQEKNMAAEAAQKLFVEAASDTVSGQWDLLILDEIMAAITVGFIDLQTVAEFIKSKPQGLEVVTTGRNAPQELVELADYVSEINAVKHPMERGITAREGIEF